MYLRRTSFVVSAEFNNSETHWMMSVENHLKLITIKAFQGRQAIMLASCYKSTGNKKNVQFFILQCTHTYSPTHSTLVLDLESGNVSLLHAQLEPYSKELLVYPIYHTHPIQTTLASVWWSAALSSSPYKCTEEIHNNLKGGGCSYGAEWVLCLKSQTVECERKG